jgi:hypothetical protein
MKTVLKWIFIIAIIACVIQHIPCSGTEMSLFVPIVILIIVLMLMKRWFPFIFNVLKMIFLFIARSFAKILWQRPERKGGATVRPHRIRWRQ